MNWRPWNKDIKRMLKEDEQTKEEVERRLTYLESQVKVLEERAILKDEVLHGPG
jgi:hypothetical protein